MFALNAINKKIQYFTVFTITLILSIFYRIYNLGYSNFLQDEVGAQNYLFDHQNFIDFLFSRSIGPGQFIVSNFFNSIFFNSNPQLFVRLPFAVISVVANIYLYLILKKHINRKTAILTFIFVSLSGLFIAFSRMVQYQSFLIFFVYASLNYLFQYINNKNDKNILIAGLFSGVSFLFHYDALSIIIPIAIYLIVNKNFKSLLYYLVSSVFIPLIFYVPFALSDTFSKTYNYLLYSRIINDFKFDSIYHSIKLLSIYHPKELIFILVVFTTYFLFMFLRKNKIQKTLSLLFILSIFARFVFINKINYLYIISIILFIAIYLLYLKSLKDIKEIKEKKLSFVIIWFLFSFFSYLIFFNKPLTHVYTFLIPLFILFGYYTYNIKRHKNLFKFSIVILYISMISYNYSLFIDIKTKFPWDNEKYIFGYLYNNNKQERFNILESLGVGFGIPYNRDWYEIQKITDNLKTSNNIASYSTNERYRISKYYMQHLKYLDTDYDLYIYIKNPYSLNYIYPKNGKIINETDNYILYVFEEY